MRVHQKRVSIYVKLYKYTKKPYRIVVTKDSGFYTCNPKGPCAQTVYTLVLRNSLFTYFGASIYCLSTWASRDCDRETCSQESQELGTMRVTIGV